MSQRALLLAVRDHLRQQMQLAEAECDVMFDGQPYPMAGERFLAVWAGEWRGQDIEGLDEYYGVQITVTRRVSYAPLDRVASPLTGADYQALDKTLEQVRAILHMDPPSAGTALNYPVLSAANALISASGAENGFDEPLRFRDGGRPEPKGPDWFSAAPDSAVCGIAQTLTFSGARRTQTIESMT